MRWTYAPMAVLAAACAPAHAVQYLTIEQAQKLLLPGAIEFRSVELTMTDAQRQAVGKASGVRVRESLVRSWSARDGRGALIGRMFFDEVTGKHDLISYALALDRDGRILGIEILDYRENYGGQIRDATWRAQFRGKTARDPIRIDADIASISGATLSCAHVADGVRRLLSVHELLLKNSTE